MQIVLSAIESFWKQYPDKRLGQLLLNVCKNTNLFAIEGEKLLELLLYNIFLMEGEYDNYEILYGIRYSWKL